MQGQCLANLVEVVGNDAQADPTFPCRPFLCIGSATIRVRGNDAPFAPASAGLGGTSGVSGVSFSPAGLKTDFIEVEQLR